MRQLRVVGLGDDHETVILEDPIRHERFAVPGDEQLRAAARGDIRRLGQMEIEITSPLRPRDIQARVRAGESVDDVAAAGGVSAAHVERFAYPVLLERARVAEISRRAHPLLPDTSTRADGRTLGEIVAATFAARGQDLDDGRWDASKIEGVPWVVTLSWSTGRSDNVARWEFKPGSAGGTVEPCDDPARELLGQEPVGGPRRVDKPESGTTGDTLELPDALDEAPALAASGDIAPAGRSASSGHASGHAQGGHGQTGPRRSERAAARRGGRPPRPGARPGPAPGVSPTDDPVPAPRGAQRAEPRPDTTRPDTTPSDTTPSDTTPAGPVPPSSPATETATGDGGEGGRRGRRSHPIVPSWEDVLLGTRSPRT